MRAARSARPAGRQLMNCLSRPRYLRADFASNQSLLTNFDLEYAA
jgi:hypothetical protein